MNTITPETKKELNNYIGYNQFIEELRKLFDTPVNNKIIYSSSGIYITEHDVRKFMLNAEMTHRILLHSHIIDFLVEMVNLSQNHIHIGRKSKEVVRQLKLRMIEQACINKMSYTDRSYFKLKAQLFDDIKLEDHCLSCQNRLNSSDPHNIVCEKCLKINNKE